MDVPRDRRPEGSASGIGVRKVWVSRAVAVALTFVLLLVGEMALRLAGWSHEPETVNIVVWNRGMDVGLRSGEDLHRFDSDALWLPRPGAALPWAKDERVSSQGFRGEDPTEEAVVRLLILGDSTTFGYGVRYEESYGQILEHHLAERLGDRLSSPEVEIQVLNGGVIGSTVLQGLARYQEIRRTWKPDIVIEAFGAINEHWPAHGPCDQEKMAYFAGMDDSGEALYARLNRSFRVVQAVSFLFDLGRAQADDYKNEERYLSNPDYERRVAPAVFGTALAELRSAVAADGGTLIALRVPRRVGREKLKWPVKEYDPELERFATQTGTLVVNAYQAFREDARDEDQLFIDSDHPSPSGHAIIGRMLCLAIEPAVEELLRTRRP